MALLLLAVPGVALALGLGDIHVSSHLDQPLAAQIRVLDLTPGAVQSLSVRLASSRTFAQYGLNRPAYLDGARTRIVRTADGQVIVHLTSSAPVTDPVLTLLLKASWDRGELIREYTLLLNPPLYVAHPGGQAVRAVAPVVTASGQREGTIRPSAPGPAPASAAPAAAAVSQAAPPAAPPRSVQVRPGETLSGIASRVGGAAVGSGQTQQWMVAIYQANPQAFDHNMNLLRAGTVLSIPSRSSVAQVSPASAWNTIRQQNQAWRGASAAPSGAGPGRLRLVAPQGGGAQAAGGGPAGAGAGGVQALKAQVQALQSELAREKRLVQLKSAALAQLQAQVLGKPKASTAAAPGPAASPSVAARPATRAVTPPVPRLAKARTPARPQPAVQTSPGSFLSDTLKTYWWAAVALVVLLLGLVAARLVRSRREEGAADEALLGGAGAAEEPEHDAVPAPVLVRPAGDLDAGETTHEHPRFAMQDSAASLVAKHVTADETISSETALNLEQGDPLAEADFHMAYGLYDQAADLIRIALQREPDRRDLKLKLLEVFFVWGNKEQFIETAHELAESRAQAAPGEWEKVVIMGRQLAPDDPLFADAAVSGAASAGVDLDLEGGQARVDFGPLGDAFPATAGGGTGSSSALDLDFGAALGEPDSHETREDSGAATDLNAALPELDSTITETGLTREMPDHLAGGESLEGGLEPTVEQPAPALAEHAALRQKVDALNQGSDRTAELAIDDLGLDLGTFETTLQPGMGAESPTLVAGLDEQSRRNMALADTSGEPATPEPTGTTSAWHIDESELESLLSGEGPNGHDSSATSRLTVLDTPGVDFDLGAEEADKVEDNGLDFDVGTATVPHADLTSHAPITVDSEASELEPLTLSEVGTKLDLARAYMDMGDPEGARSILEEVMHEGSDSQRQEAGRLLESLPG